jgi:ribonuclease P protein component
MLAPTPPDPSAPPRIAFSIARSVGSAVQRNRLRRRLRALVREPDLPLVPGASYLVQANPAAAALDTVDLRSNLRSALARAAG